VAENSLGKILRLPGCDLRLSGGGVQAPPARSGKKTSRLSTEQIAGGRLQLGSVYRAAWGNVHVGDVLEFGPELWKVIPASSYPNHPSSADSGTIKAAAGSPSQGSSGAVPAGESGFGYDVMRDHVSLDAWEDQIWGGSE